MEAQALVRRDLRVTVCQEGLLGHLDLNQDIGCRTQHNGDWTMDYPDTGLLLTTTNTHCSLADAQLSTKVPSLRVRRGHVKNLDSPLVPALSFVQREKTIPKSSG